MGRLSPNLGQFKEFARFTNKRLEVFNEFQDLSHQKMGAIEKTCAIKQHETLSTLTRPSASIHLEKLICVSAPPELPSYLYIRFVV